VGSAAQDQALLCAARDLLPWRDIVLRGTPPATGEVGQPLPSDDGQPRWLIARPLPDTDPWSAQDERILETLAAAAAVTIELGHLQGRLAEQALLDPLTSVANRRKLDVELRRLCGSGQPFAVFVIDLDAFKEINDRLGHEVGDAVLGEVAIRLRANRREGDVVSRMGGDEFVLLLPGVGDLDAACTLADQVASAIAQPLDVGPWQLLVRGSIGVAVAPLDGDMPSALLRVADDRMYENKRRKGEQRDLVVVSRPIDRRGAAVGIPSPR
jgi:diguanylate cyclase (GGDEF)-like protein